MAKRKTNHYKAALNKSDAPETDHFICFHGINRNDSWVNAEKKTLDSGLDAVFIASFCGDDVAFGPSNLRKLTSKLLKWADEMEDKERCNGRIL